MTGYDNHAQAAANVIGGSQAPPLMRDCGFRALSNYAEGPVRPR
jgi:hypothetical protein